MKYIHNLMAWLKARKAEQAKIANQQLIRLSELRIQLREFDGEIYIAIDDTPIVKVSPETNDAISSLEEARKTFRAYITKQTIH